MLPTYPHESCKQQEIVYSIVYYATPKNSLYMGDGSIDELADDISTSSGVSGHNIEYLFRLADFMRECLPKENDEHVFALDRRIRTKIGLSSDCTLPWKTLMMCENFRNIIYNTKPDTEQETTVESPPSSTQLAALV